MRITGLLLLLLTVIVTAHAENETDNKDTNKDTKTLKVLYIGNSYTAFSKGQLNTFLAKSPLKDSHFDYIGPGGKTLAIHLKNPEVLKKIKEGEWNYVVLQEQSMVPAIPGAKDHFLKAAKELCKVIREAGAEPVFFMTWGGRDGDKRNKELFPDYKTMQKRLTDAYEEAGKENEATVVPVGLLWSDARDALKDDYKLLYRGDGRHQGKYGAFLIACAFFKTLFKTDLAFVKPKDDHEKLIKELVLKHGK